MAYNVSSAFRQKCYSGESNYIARLKISDGTNMITIPNTEIESIKISDPIIDTTSEIFYVGSFISKQLTIKFKDLSSLALNIQSGREVELDIGQYVNDDYEYCPIGKFIIDELAENYQTKCEITCLDYGVKFKNAIDYSPCFTSGSATIDTILAYICTQCGVTLGTFPSTNGNIQIGTYDATVSGKEWISYIAEIKGCNAKISRSGALNLIPVKQTSTISINALSSKSWELGERFKISKVIHPTRGFEYGNTTYNTLYIRQTNPFIENTTTVENIYNAVNDAEIWNIKNENFADVSLDSWDLITYTLGNDNYYTFYNCDITFQQSCMVKVETKIPSKQEQQTTNYIPATLSAFKKTVGERFDLVNGEITLWANKTNENASDISETKARISSDEATIELLHTNIDANGNITEVQTTNGFTFNQQGLNIYTSENTFNTLINNVGTYYKDGNKIVSQTTKDGTITKDMVLYGKYYYGVDADLDVEDFTIDDAMFVGQKYTDNNDEDGFGHFYAGV